MHSLHMGSQEAPHRSSGGPFSELLCLAALLSVLGYGLYANAMARRTATFRALGPQVGGALSDLHPVADFVGRDVENRAFVPGEKLLYTVIYKGMGVGHASLTVKSGVSYSNRPTLQFMTTAKSTRFFDKFFRVRDFNSSTVDKKSLVSLSFHQNLREGRFRVVRDVFFDYERKVFTWKEIFKGKTHEKTAALTEPLRDVLCSLYYARTQPLEPGKEYRVKIVQRGQVYSMPIKVGTRSRRIATPAGKFTCLRVEPMVKDSIFRSKDGRLLVWMTDDAIKLPVLIEARISVGNITIRLDRAIRA